MVCATVCLVCAAVCLSVCPCLPPYACSLFCLCVLPLYAFVCSVHANVSLPQYILLHYAPGCVFVFL